MSTRSLVFSALFFFLLLGLAIAASGCGSNAAGDDPSLSDDNSGQAPDDDVYIDDDDDYSDDDDDDDSQSDDDTSDDDTDDDSDDDDTSDDDDDDTSDDHPSGGSIDAPDPDETVGPQFWVTGDVEDLDGIVEVYVTLYWGDDRSTNSVVVYAGDGTDDTASFNSELDVENMGIDENEWFTMKLKVRDSNDVVTVVDVVDLKWSNDSDHEATGYFTSPNDGVDVTDDMDVVGRVDDPDAIKRVSLVINHDGGSETVSLFYDATPSEVQVSFDETVDLYGLGVEEGLVGLYLIVTDGNNRQVTVDQNEVYYTSEEPTGDLCDGSRDDPFRLRITCNSPSCVTYTSQDGTMEMDDGDVVTVSWLAEDYSSGDDLWVGASTTTRPTFSDVGDCRVISWRTTDENGWAGEWYVTVGD